MRAFLEKYKYPLLITIISAIVYFRWLSFGIFSASDWGFQYAQTLREVPDFAVWNPYGTGEVNILLWRLIGPGSVLYGIFGNLDFASNVADKFLIFWPWIFGAGLSSYFLIKKIIQSEIGAFIGAIVLTFNTYFLAINTQGHILLSSASVFVNLTLLSFIVSLENKSLKYGVITALMLFLSAINDFRMTYIAVWLMLLYALYHTFVIEWARTMRSIWLGARTFLVPLGIFALLNVFWVLPSMFIGSLQENSVLGRSLFGNNYFDITKAITLFHPFWKDGMLDWFIVQRIPVYFWFIPMIAFLGSVLGRKQKNIVFFSLLALLGIFLSKQVGEPFTSFYEWMYLNFPGFNAFREATKFYYVIAMAYAVLIGYVVAYFHENYSKNRTQKIALGFVTGLIACVFLANTPALMTGEISSIMREKQIPQEYRVLQDFIEKQDGFFRTLWIPRTTRWAYSTNAHPKMNAIDVTSGDWKLAFKDVDYSKWTLKDRMVDTFNKPFSNAMFDNTSIKYVILPSRDASLEDDMYMFYGGEFDPRIWDWYKSKLDQVPWLKKVDLPTGEVIVYENQNYKEHFYLTAAPETLDGSVTYRSFNSQQISSTQYKLQIKNIHDGSYVQFTEEFHPDWMMRIGDFHWYDALLHPKDYFLDVKMHEKNNLAFNAWKISKSDIIQYVNDHFVEELSQEGYPKIDATGKRDFKYYVLNPDGTMDIELTVYFRAQSYLYLGCVFSLLVLLACIGYLCRPTIRKYLDKNPS